jgi:hypothetical protein
MRVKTERIVPVILAISLWTTGNALMSYRPAHADEPVQVANGDPNNPNCTSTAHNDYYSNCFETVKGQPECSPSGYCKRVTGYSDYYCIPGDTGSTVSTGNNIFGQPLTTVVGGNCHTLYNVRKTAQVYHGPCAYDPTIHGCACTGTPSTYIGTVTVISTDCTDNNGTVASITTLKRKRSPLLHVAVGRSAVSNQKQQAMFHQ